VQLLDVFRSRRVLVIVLLGFSSGLPLLLTGQVLGAWMTAVGVDLTTIGAFSLVGLPYTFKWLWAPLVDRYRLPLLGRRRGWLLATQLALMVAIAVMGSLDPRAAPAVLAVTAVAVALLSATQDVVVDAFNADTLRTEERAAGSAMYVTGYRGAMLVTGTVALALADVLPWSVVYVGLAAMMSVGVVGTLLAREPPSPPARPATVAEAVWRPVALLLRQPRIAVVVAFVPLYKVGDQFAQLMAIPFLKKGLGFSFAEIATLYNIVGFTGTLAGALVGGGLVARHGVRRALLPLGIAQTATNLAWVGLSVHAPSLPLLAGAVAVDNLANAMGTSAFVAYLMSRCDRAVSATQLAVLTSLSTVLSRLGGAAAGATAASVGWPAFWLATLAVAIPGLLLVPHLPYEEEAAPATAPEQPPR